MKPANPLTTRRADKYDYVHRALLEAISKPIKSYLWTPAYAITFVPGLCNTVFGDGRALFKLTTINNRPAFWIIRGDSGWACGMDGDAPYDAPEFGEFTEEILCALEEQFGNARCSYSGSNLYIEPQYRSCDCEQCAGPYIDLAKWPMVDGEGGCSWRRMKWPKLRQRYQSIPHPFSSWAADLIATNPETRPTP